MRILKFLDRIYAIRHLNTVLQQGLQPTPRLLSEAGLAGFDVTALRQGPLPTAKHRQPDQQHQKPLQTFSKPVLSH